MASKIRASHTTLGKRLQLLKGQFHSVDEFECGARREIGEVVGDLEQLAPSASRYLELGHYLGVRS
jgi:hypothetical protein